jgi:hypothetical protein
MTSKSLLVLSRCLLSGAEKWKKVPLLRRSVRDSTGKVFTSPTLASQFNQMSNWNRRLEMYAHAMYAHEVHAYKVHTNEVHAHEVHAHEVHAHEVHAHEIYACEMHTL